MIQFKEAEDDQAGGSEEKLGGAEEKISVLIPQNLKPQNETEQSVAEWEKGIGRIRFDIRLRTPGEIE